MFDFFKPNEEIIAKDIVWLNINGKKKGFLNLLSKYPDSVCIAWFTDTFEVFNPLITIQNNVFFYREVKSSITESKTVIFLEHYPLLSKEKDLMRQLKAKQYFFLNALDEPLFQQFGGENIVSLMKNLGADEEEPIEHPLITKAIINAQKKMESKVISETSANSSQAWFSMNMP